jgi:pimeloyl-ACP methyl ester carboxylesterase
MILLLTLLLLGATSFATKVPPPPTSILSFTQTLDHFRFTDERTFQQKVLIYDSFYQPKGPILMYFGNEGQIEDFYNNTGAIFEIAEQVHGLIVFLEHRFYGSTLPFGDQSYDNDKLVYLTIEQALADMALFISSKKTFLNCSGPVINFGGSYGGMLSAWFQVKYPHLVLGSLAASAPVDIYPGENKEEEFFNAGMFVYGKFGSSKCESWIRKALQRMVVLGNTTEGKLMLSNEFQTCKPILQPIDVDRLILYVNGALSTMAMVDYPFPSTFVTPMPANPVSYACNNLTSHLGNKSSDRLLVNGLNQVINVFVNYTNQLKCHNVSEELLSSTSPSVRRIPSSITAAATPSVTIPPHSLGDINRPWNYQACTELILEPLTSDGNGFFVPNPSLIPKIENACKSEFGIDTVTRPNHMRISFGNGKEIVQSTHNIIFSDGEKDPWRVGGVPDNAIDIGDGSVVHLFIKEGAHHQDLRYSNSMDPITVTNAKKLELEIIGGWIDEYYKEEEEEEERKREQVKDD